MRWSQPGGKRVIQMSLGPHHSAALTQKGEVYTWGQAGRLVSERVKRDSASDLGTFSCPGGPLGPCFSRCWSRWCWVVRVGDWYCFSWWNMMLKFYSKDASNISIVLSEECWDAHACGLGRRTNFGVPWGFPTFWNFDSKQWLEFWLEASQGNAATSCGSLEPRVCGPDLLWPQSLLCGHGFGWCLGLGQFQARGVWFGKDLEGCEMIRAVVVLDAYRLVISRLLRDWWPPEQDLWAYGAKRLSQRAHDDQGRNHILGWTNLWNRKWKVHVSSQPRNDGTKLECFDRC